MHAYLQGAGVPSVGLRSIGELEGVGRDLSAVVIFPDEFPSQAVSTLVQALLFENHELVVVLVTGTPQMFRFASGSPPERAPVIVLPKPAFGWTILDALRAHTAAAPP
jgi:hypothetical protein